MINGSVMDHTTGLFPRRPAPLSGHIQLALSGGRSSGTLLALLLEQHGGKLPDNYQVIFTNTGKEDSKTLNYLHRIETEWHVPIVWLEFVSLVSRREVTIQQVTYETAARNGEPFRRLLEAKPDYMPRRVARTCTMYLKTLTSWHYVQHVLQWETWITLLGYRADEKHRLHAARLRCGKEKLPYDPEAPLIQAGIEKAGVLAFWRAQSFDLNIPEEDGNCDLCFLKGKGKLMKAIRRDPAKADWWIEGEALANSFASKFGGERRFTMYPNGGYAKLKQDAVANLPPPVDEMSLEDLECNCTD